MYVRNVVLQDAGTIEARTPLNKNDETLTTATTLDVMMGERKPKMKKIGKGGNKVEGVAGKNCTFEID